MKMTPEIIRLLGTPYGVHKNRPGEALDCAWFSYHMLRALGVRVERDAIVPPRYNAEAVAVLTDPRWESVTSHGDADLVFWDDPELAHVGVVREGVVFQTSKETRGPTARPFSEHRTPDMMLKWLG